MVNPQGFYFNIDGEPIALEEWCQLVTLEEYKRIAATQVGPYWVSTVWLGIDFGLGRGFAPVIFESMIFADDDAHSDPRLPDLWRYPTLAAAEEGHAELVELVTQSVAELATSQPEKGEQQ